MEILLIRESERNISRIAKFIKERYVKKILPRNILVHSTGKKSASDIALTIRKIVRNRVLYEHPSLTVKVYEFIDKCDTKKRNILITNLYEIENILHFVKNKHGISFNDYEIEEGSIISIPVNNGSKVAKKIFTPAS